MKRAAFVCLALTVAVSAASAGIEWRMDVRAAFEEAEGRGVPLFVYLSRDD